MWGTCHLRSRAPGNEQYLVKRIKVCYSLMYKLSEYINLINIHLYICIYKFNSYTFTCQIETVRYGPITKSPAKCHKDDLQGQGISPMMKGWDSWGWTRRSPEVPPNLNYSGLLWSCQSLCFFLESDWERYFDTWFIKIMDTLFLQWSRKQKIKW